MNQTEKIVIEIVKEIFSGEPAVIPEDPNRNAVCKELINQSVYTLAYGWLKDHNYISSDSIQHGMQQMLRQTSKWYFMMDQQQVLVDLLTKEGYVFAVMKGSANAAGYPMPELRKSGDIDILIKEEEYDEIRRFLLQNGYALKEGLDHGKHHFEMTKKGVTIEVHKRPGGINREKTDKNTELVAFFQHGLDSVGWKELYDYKFPVLPDLQNGIMLLLHTAQHLSTTGIGLRHLIDWMLFAERYLSDDCWTREFEQAAKKAGKSVSEIQPIKRIMPVFKQVTDQKGRIYFYTDDIGLFTFKETATCEGYYLNDEEYSFTINADLTISGDTRISNIPFGTAVMKKVDAEGSPLAGAQVQFFDEYKRYLGQGISDAKGRVYFVSPGPGSYYFREIKAPNGYQITNDHYHFRIADDYSITGTLTLVNHRGGSNGGVYSKTGDSQHLMMWLALAAAAIVIAGGTGCLMFIKRRKEKNKDN